jgi:hypothetical protein
MITSFFPTDMPGICARSKLKKLWSNHVKLTCSAYTVVESSTHSIAVDILTSPSANIGTLFVSSSEGTYFVEALADTNRNEYGIVDYETLVGLDGIGIANVVANREEVVGWNEVKKLKSVITFDDGEFYSYSTDVADV